jgi:transmembrane sensor
MTLHRDIEDQALDWLIRQDEADWSSAEQAALDNWLGKSMAHKAAYWRVAHGWHEADRIRSLGAAGQQEHLVDRVSPSWWWRPMLAAASVIAMLAVGLTIFAPSGTRPSLVQEARFDTPIGGKRTIPLSDGSQVELNTATIVRAAVNNRSRDIWLDHGEAYFEVAHRDGLPFVVHAGEQMVTVLGTKFSVRRDKGRVTVNVVEGRVRVENVASPDGHAAIITAGDTAIARGPSTLITAKSEERVENALAWRGGMLNFDQTTLADAAAEFNRYNRKPIVIVDSGAADIRIGGSFQTSNVEAFVDLLRDAYGLKIQENDKAVKISS